jgi:hypothetical protein
VFCGQLRLGWHLCQAADPQAKGVVERLQEYLETSFEPGRSFANELDFADQLDAWFCKANLNRPGQAQAGRRACGHRRSVVRKACAQVTRAQW